MKLLGSAVSVIVVLAFALIGVSYGDQGQVTIKRDNYGVGHVYADTVYGLFYGYGYAVGQDRLFQMEMAKRSTQGKVAEVIGEEYVEFDKRIRGNYNPISIQRQLDRLSESDADIFNGYAAGMNAWIEEVTKNTDRLMPKEFIDFGFQPEPWSAFDVAMIFVGSMANRFGDFNTELANVQIYKALVNIHDEKTALAIFEQLIPINIEDAPTTIPKGEWSPPAKPMPQTTNINNTALLRSIANRAADLNSLSPSSFNTKAPYGLSGASNCVVVGKKKAEGAKAILMNGPQFGWYLPGYVYSIGLHGAGFDLVGNTPFAYPIILFGHNRDIAWGSTWGAGDMVDIYIEALNAENPHEYRYKGNWLPMEERTEIIKVKDGQSVEFTAYRTIHGPI
ncbi:MAG: penicillin acylase family protein, partial [Desulfobacterales bacterium]